MSKQKRVILVTDATDHKVSKYDLEGSRAQLIERINHVFDDAERDYVGVEGVELYTDWRPREWSEGEDLFVYARRPENEKEKKKRKADELARKQSTEVHELKLLQQLQAKYAGKV
jgi:hypothetical protein